jgi:hypothetical protein
MAKRVGDATAEGWAEVEKSATQMIADVKEALNK